MYGMNISVCTFYDLVAVSIWSSCANGSREWECLVRTLFFELDLEASESNLTTVEDFHRYIAAFTLKPGFACLACQTVTIGAPHDGAKRMATDSCVRQ
jgi:hypothetical protein